MDFSIPVATQELVAKVRVLVEQEAFPLERPVADRGFPALLPELRQARRRVQQHGLWCPQLPRDLGGLGLSLLDFAHVSQQLGRSFLGHYLFNCQAPDAGNMEILREHGTPEQRSQFLAPLVRGDIRSAFAMTEPDRPGSNPTWLDTSATLAGGDWVIRGRKWFTSAADGAAFVIVMAVTDPQARPHQRASQFIVPVDAPGFRLVENLPVLGHTGGDYDSHALIQFDNCRVPAGALLGERGAGFRIAQDRLGPGRIHHTMRWIGICERSLELLCRRAASRLIAPDQPLGTRQTIQTWIADSRAQIDAARLAVLHAAWKIDRQGMAAARVEISCIKYLVADVMLEVIDRAIQAHGAAGLTNETPLATFLRNERGARIYDGADEVHKTVVARHLLREYGLEI